MMSRMYEHVRQEQVVNAGQVVSNSGFQPFHNYLGEREMNLPRFCPTHSLCQRLSNNIPRRLTYRNFERLL